MPQKSHAPFSLQLAIQGGGAKICALLAAMEAIQTLQRENLIVVKRIAGTSAGAIVGALFAANIDMAIVRERLRGFSAAQLARAFPAPGLNLLTRLIRGRPLWKPDFLVAELKRFLEKEARVSNLGDLAKKSGTELLVVAASLSESRKVVHREPQMNVIQALLDSCGIPFCFRTWSRAGSAVVVDGGICENLPSDELIDYTQSDGPVVGISFDSARGRTPDGFTSFSMALLDTAMNNSMSRARLKLGPDNLCSIPTEIGTFDFAKALNEGLADTEYGRVRDFTSSFFRNYVSNRLKKTEVISRDAWMQQSSPMMNVLGDVYRRQHEGSKLHYKSCSLILQANSLSGDENTEDLIMYRVVFHTGDDPIYCHAVFLSEIENATISGKSELTVLDPNGTPIDLQKIPIRYPDEQHARLLLFFLPRLESNTGPYTMVVKDVVHDAVRALKEGRKDELIFAPLRAAKPIEQVDLVFQWPAATGRAKMVPKDGDLEGEEMSGPRLTQYLAPLGFDAVGWVGRNVTPNQDFGVDLYFSQD